ALRLGFLLPPIASAGGGPVLRRSFELSQDHFFRILVIALLALLPAMFVLFAGQYAVYALRRLPPLQPGATLLARGGWLRDALAAFLAIVLGTYYAAAVTLSAASAVFYRERVATSRG